MILDMVAPHAILDGRPPLVALRPDYDVIFRRTSTPAGIPFSTHWD